MRLKKDSQIFNLMDTNGRRNDVVNALQGYLSILDDVQNGKRMKWACLPGSLAQYEFYRQAIRRSPEVFKQHGPYDQLQKAMERRPDFRQAVRNGDIGWIREHRGAYEGLIRQFDKGIEDRARHYTSNLVKLGLAVFRFIFQIQKLLVTYHVRGKLFCCGFQQIGQGDVVEMVDPAVGEAAASHLEGQAGLHVLAVKIKMPQHPAAVAGV